MNESDKQEFYNALKTYPINKSIIKYSVTHDTCYTDTQYCFGEYRIDFLHWEPESTFTPRDRIRIYKNNGYMCHWNKSTYKNQYVYDMYMTVKNKSDNKIVDSQIIQEKDSIAKPVQKKQSFAEKYRKVLDQVKIVFLNGGLDSDYIK